ncbi:hypothetical protein I656_00092 [Geobacillus sp. WSUCF1]|nr:hypothetical protein I656_00092 [Geobacillus sp. WSUCF1]
MGRLCHERDKRLFSGIALLWKIIPFFFVVYAASAVPSLIFFAARPRLPQNCHYILTQM